jgi:hypothetical protein
MTQWNFFGPGPSPLLGSWSSWHGLSVFAALSVLPGVFAIARISEFLSWTKAFTSFTFTQSNGRCLGLAWCGSGFASIGSDRFIWLGLDAILRGGVGDLLGLDR